MKYLPTPTDTLLALFVLFALLVLAHVVVYVVDSHQLRSVPGPWLAKFSDAWLVYVSIQGRRSEAVYELHKQHGPIIRIAPNHVSVADPDALQAIYGHHAGTTKANFYDAFVSIARGLFNSRDRAEHARKRKIVSHAFAPKNVAEFEPNVRQYVGQLVDQWDRLCDLAVKDCSGDEGEGGWYGRNGRLWLDCLPWCNYLSLDTMADLCFGFPFGMIGTGQDSAPVAIAQDNVMASYGTTGPELATARFPAIEVINGRGEFSATMGVLPPLLRPYVKRLPWFSRGQTAVHNLAGLAVAAVSKRLTQGEVESGRVDFLTKLSSTKDGNGEVMGKEELTAEALTLLVAGSDTTSNTVCSIIYHLAANPGAQRKLQAELDSVLENSDSGVSHYADIKSLPYLEACINEAARIHSTTGIGLARLVPQEGLTAGGRMWTGGTVLSVPTYTIHRDVESWGQDVEVFRPERWAGRVTSRIDTNLSSKESTKAFNPFSFGPRACVGKNLATMELFVTISSLLRRYDFVLEHPDQPLKAREGLLRRPLECRVGIRRREQAN